MNLKEQIIASAQKRGATYVKVNESEKGVSLSIRMRVRFTGHDNLRSLLQAVREHSSLDWMS